VSDRAVLRERVRAERAAARAKEDTTAAGIPCATQVERALHLTGLHVVGTGTADGEPVLVVTGTNTGDHPVAVSVAPDGCRIREHVTL
jgi:outer membrane lipopolysaccharide assembly protein LptE/RlpB